jgi:exopolyphosphatase/guanosine-5'-triphosphate,3'-diphosphate pyrophosphatase
MAGSKPFRIRPLRRRDGRWRHVYAAVDLGTNNCRLLVVRPMRRGFRVIDAFSRIVRLGEGVSTSGALSREAMDRTIEALKVCAAKIERSGVTRARHVATAACRTASNCPDFTARVMAETGLELDIISSAEEARLAVAGCASLLDPACRYALVFDIGGGSTELIWVRITPDCAPEILAWTSLSLGVVTLTECFGGAEMSHTRFADMVDFVRAELAAFDAAFEFDEAVPPDAIQLLGTSGTVTTLAGLHLGLERYDRRRVDGLWVSSAAMDQVIARLVGMSYAERRAQPCIGAGRADLVIAGCAILEAIKRTWPCDRLRVADRGLREGVLLGLMNEADQHSRHARRRRGRG